MKAEITMSQLWYNTSLLNFFFREQSIKTLEDLLDRAVDDESDVLGQIEASCECMDITLDEFEEDCYDMGTVELAETYGIELKDEDEIETYYDNEDTSSREDY